MKRKKILVLTPAELEALTTKQLLARLKRLQQCEEAIELSDCESHEFNNAGEIKFKASAEWVTAHHQIKQILAMREHIPKGIELIEQKKQQQAQLNRTFDQRIGKKKLHV